MTHNTYHIITFGCQMNAYDSEVMAGILEARGLKPSKSAENADVLLMNTCIVRGSAEKRALGHIASLRFVKDNHPNRIFAVCGCMAQRDASALLEKAPHLDLVLGTRSIPKLSALLDHIIAGDGPLTCVEEEENGYEVASIPIRKSSLRALITIISGCNNFCTYCIVPHVRGREKSRSVGTIIDEIEALVNCGCREVTLVGQNVNSYSDGKTDFAGLLERVNDIQDLWRIRYITSHPRDANRRHLNAAASMQKVCNNFHLPVQSGSTSVLERMNRGYTRENYLKLIADIREIMPDATITTDLLVGFPGETDADYQQTLELAKEVRFDAAYTFLYNVREGTEAARWEDDVPLITKKERLAQLIEVQEKISNEKNLEMLGKTYDLLVEGPASRSSQNSGNQMLGRTTGDKCVIFDGSKSDIGQMVKVRITESASHTLFGEKIDSPVVAAMKG